MNESAPTLTPEQKAVLDGQVRKLIETINVMFKFELEKCLILVKNHSIDQMQFIGSCLAMAARYVLVTTEPDSLQTNDGERLLSSFLYTFSEKFAEINNLDINFMVKAHQVDKDNLQ